MADDPTVARARKGGVHRPPALLPRHPTTVRAVGPGNQLPRVAAAVVRRGEGGSSWHDNDNSNSEREEEEDASQSSSRRRRRHRRRYNENDNDDVVAAWRLRDVAVTLLRDRRELYRVDTMNQERRSMIVSSNFAVKWALDRIARDRSLAVRQAFHGAASSVLLAIQQAAAATPPEASANNLELDPHGGRWPDDLPPSLRWQSAAGILPTAANRGVAVVPTTTVQGRRMFSLERSFENKEYAKRKGGKTDANYTPPPPRAPKVKPKPVPTTTATASATSSAPVLLPPPPPPPPLRAQPPPNVASVGTTTKIVPRSTGTQAAVTRTVATATVSNSTSGPGPKFTRNTPASSAAALDVRFHSARAILCVAGNLTFAALTPPTIIMSEAPPVLDVLNVPQNRTTVASTSSDDDDDEEETNNNAMSAGSSPTVISSSTVTESVNMGAVLLEAQTLGQRTIFMVENAVRRAKLRYQYRKDSVRYERRHDKDFLRIENPFSFHKQQQQQQYKKSKVTLVSDEDNDDDDTSSADGNDGGDERSIPYQPNSDSITYAWQDSCLPRFLDVLHTGAGHAVYHDVEWSSRHGRIADLLRALSSPTDNDDNDFNEGNFGPHLIIATEPELTRFAQEFFDVNSYLRLIISNESKSLHALTYSGSKRHRCNLRKYFSQATGLPEAPFHVLITSYDVFLEDYLHFFQLPFETVVLDDGVAWMATADQNSPLGSIWDSAIFSSNDHHVGLAGTSFKKWDFSKNEIPEADVKEAWIGLTARHRIATASAFALKQRHSTELIPVSALIDFVAPQFSAVVKEEWDRSKISADAASMKHFRKLVARSVVVHSSDSPVQDMCTLALQALTGKLPLPDRSGDPLVPLVISDDDFVSHGKVAFSRRATLLWLGPLNQSWLRYELGCANFQDILDAMKFSNYHGHFCEEITTASSTTSSGATGQVAGTMAYRLAVRCGRHFGSEPGLRQHLSAQHAPPGTWLCRTCSSDCMTSQSRTHHERSCGQPINGASGENLGGSVGATPTVGQASKKTGVGKKKSGHPASQPGATIVEEKDPDGSFRVPGYRGVWVNKAGKHFVKIDGKRLNDSAESHTLLLFDTTEEAAKKHDEVVVQAKNLKSTIELNFKPDGSKIGYEDITPASTSGLGGSAASVVPALSVINIKDLPPDVKPLLRDPRQTSRTGGNSKRHIYAYRGVCRQARKGHDRWQSQISFMGVNHYLGTFDSEWDAAAIYAWAHLILYGEEATRQAQKEGEEAAAAYEQEKRDIAAGKIPEPPSKPEKKKTPVRKSKAKKSGSDTEAGGAASDGESDVLSKKRKASPKESLSIEKKQRTTSRPPKTEKEAVILTLAQGVLKAPLLAPRPEFDHLDDSAVMIIAARKIKMARAEAYCASAPTMVPCALDVCLRPCLPGKVIPHRSSLPVGGAMLIGLSPSTFGWDLQDFVESSQLRSEQDVMAALQLLAVEYDDDGVNEKFRSVVQGTICVIGSADKITQQMSISLGLGSVPLGGSVGKLDCHIGGVPGSCSERAACIRYAPTACSRFQFSCLSRDDIVTLNGRRITPEMGSFPLVDEDICSVGARVFVFVLPRV